MSSEIFAETQLRLEKIKRIISSFHKDRCPHCGAKPLESLRKGKIWYKCPGCLSSWYENQNYEVYFMEIEAILKNGKEENINK